MSFFSSARGALVFTSALQTFLSAYGAGGSEPPPRFSLPPRSFSLTGGRLAFGGKGAYAVIELPAGVIEATRTAPGDQLEIQK